jgi:hypothetical protein
MHHRQSAVQRAAQPHAWLFLAIGLLAMGFLSRAAAAEDQPGVAMMEPVHGLVAFMSTLRPGDQPTVFARRGLCIVENFAPFLFCGPHAAADWAAGFRSHAAEGDLKNLVATFGEAHDFSQAGNRAYFSLPTTWTGLTNGKPFEEHGAWSFVLQRQSSGWRIVGYGWGVTAYTESPSVKSGS